MSFLLLFTALYAYGVRRRPPPASGTHLVTQRAQLQRVADAGACAVFAQSSPNWLTVLTSTMEERPRLLEPGSSASSLLAHTCTVPLACAAWWLGRPAARCACRVEHQHVVRSGAPSKGDVAQQPTACAAVQTKRACARCDGVDRPAEARWRCAPRALGVWPHANTGRGTGRMSGGRCVHPTAHAAAHRAGADASRFSITYASALFSSARRRGHAPDPGTAALHARARVRWCPHLGSIRKWHVYCARQPAHGKDSWLLCGTYDLFFRKDTRFEGTTVVRVRV